MGLENQGANPSGLTGKLIGRLMNRFHTSLYTDYIKNNLPADHSKILDLGCGGGKFIKFLTESNKSYQLYGLDHSTEMVALAKKINKQAIGQNRVKIIQGPVSNILIDSSTLDLITAFETVQFWPDTQKSFIEINRVLKTGGKFLIINRYPGTGSKWWKMARIKNDKEYKDKLTGAGFEQISIDLGFKNGWIVVSATKQG